MESHKRLHLKTFLMISIMVLAGPLGNVLLGKGMKTIGPVTATSPADVLHLLARVLTTGYIWMGIASLLTFFLAYMLVLSWADYSFVQPSSAFSYVVVATLSVVLLGEVVSPLRWLGIAVICLGVFVVGRTHPNTTEIR